MAKRKHPGDFSDVHKRQLFHWVGGDIEANVRARNLSAADARDQYLRYLKDDLCDGLPVKCPRVPETMCCDGQSVSLDLPMVCFTEWALSESRPHSSRYGRMAFGFSKPWVIKHGGQPVTYFSHTRRGLFLKTQMGLHEFLRQLVEVDPCPDGLKTLEIAAALRQAKYLLHFAKPFAPPQEKRKRRPKLGRAAAKTLAATRGARPRPAVRFFGPVLEFLEEREWRIVRHDKPYFAADPGKHFDSRLKFCMGTELFTLVLPDNETVKMAWGDKCIRGRLLNAAVPVTVLSFQDIGTF